MFRTNKYEIYKADGLSIVDENGFEAETEEINEAAYWEAMESALKMHEDAPDNETACEWYMIGHERAQELNEAYCKIHGYPNEKYLREYEERHGVPYTQRYMPDPIADYIDPWDTPDTPHGCGPGCICDQVEDEIISQSIWKRNKSL